MIARGLGALLQQCAKSRASSHGTAVHGFIVKVGFDADIILSNHLVNLYAKCNDFVAAHRVFDVMPDRNLVSWSAMISGYDQAGRHSMALQLFAEMPLQPNEYIYSSVVSSCASLAAVSLGEQVHAHSVKTGHDSISFVSNSLISMYMKCGCFDSAYSIFSRNSEANIISHNAMIAGFAEKAQPGKGLELFGLMKRSGLCPDKFSYIAVLGICTGEKETETGRALHCQTIKIGLETTALVGNVILTMYSRFNLLGEVEKAFQSIKEKDVITINTFIAACAHCGEHDKGLMVYREMEDEFGITPDDFTLAGVLAASAEVASIRYGGQIHARLFRTRLDFDVGVCNAIINMYAKCGCIEYVNRVFHSMSRRNLVSWNTMIIGLANHGRGKMAVDMFERMISTGLAPDSVTFIGLLAACSHSGLADEGLAYFDSMKDVYGISPEIVHMSCLIDLLGRARRSDEAESYLKATSFGNDPVIWGSLLSSCRLHGDMAVGERVARQLVELKPSTSSPYVLLSSLYASDGRWDGVQEAWKMLRGSGVKKEPGHSWIDVIGIAEKFIVGDFSHPKINEIIETLLFLNMQAKKLHL